MAKKSMGTDPIDPVAPGYPAVESLESIDVSGWEPAAIFHPVDLTDSSHEDSAK